MWPCLSEVTNNNFHFFGDAPTTQNQPQRCFCATCGWWDAPKLEIMVNGFQPSGIWDLGFNAFLTFQNFNYWSPFQSKILMWFLKQILSWCCVHDIHGLMVWLLPYTIRCIAYIIMSVHIIIKHIYMCMHQNYMTNNVKLSLGMPWVKITMVYYNPY